MRIKVDGGTVDHSQQSLCETCQLATIIRGRRLGDEIVECGKLFGNNQRVPFPVASCSHYADSRRPSLKQMEEMAWILKSDPRRNQAGFVRPTEPGISSGLMRDED